MLLSSSSMAVVCVVLVRMFGFRHFAMMFSYLLMIRTKKHIRLNRDINANHDRKYVVELKS